MRDVYVIGIGQTPIGEWWDKGVRQLAYDALHDATEDSGLEWPDALYVGNMMSSRLSGQAHLGALIADFAGWRGIEAVTVEAACASGGAAFQAGVRAVASGMVEVAAVVGVEKMTDGIGGGVISGLATAADADYEVIQGVTFVALNALIMQRYMYEHNLKQEAFAAFCINAHHNAVNNPNAMFRKEITTRAYLNAHMISPPVNLLDSSPICDGAAAVLLGTKDILRDLPEAIPVRILASTNAIDSVAIAERHDLLGMEAIRNSAQKAYQTARLAPTNIDVFELHDAFSIMAAVSLEASGFAERGRGTFLASEGEISLTGRIPVSTMGGLKARGHPVGATGVYQIVDAVTQLRGTADKNQVKDATIAMAQNVGGAGTTVITHILARE
ncbi:MAG: thiolase domain-containing protein [Anaerolineae bacterium]|nr:thiolase domain-containing protein [Anaerolineae bacterium]